MAPILVHPYLPDTALITHVRMPYPSDGIDLLPSWHGFSVGFQDILYIVWREGLRYEFIDLAELTFQRLHERSSFKDLHILAFKELYDSRWPSMASISVCGGPGIYPVLKVLVGPYVHHLT